MDIQFREYTDEDKDILLTLTNKLEEHVKALDPLRRILNSTGYKELSLQQTLDTVAKSKGKIWLAEDNGQVVGCIIGVIREQSEINKLEIGPHIVGEVLDLFVEEDYRGHGIGKRMLQKMEAYFKENTCDSMWIEVFVPNENSHAVYKNFGFMDREIGMLKRI